MRRLSIAIAIIAPSLLAASISSAGEWKGQSLSAKRQTVGQIIDCMKKRMSSDRSISYNEAGKVCKQQVMAQADNASRGPLVAADTAEKR